jgi:kynurenine formamidase
MPGRSREEEVMWRLVPEGGAATAVSLLAGVAACPDPSATGASGVATLPPAALLAQLTQGIASGNMTVVDLAQPLSPKTPVIQLPPPFANTPAIVKHEISRYDDRGPAWYWNWFELGEHVGTHFDAPSHWVTGKDLACVDEIPADQFVGPAAVIDVTADVVKNPDFAATSETIITWEKAHGRIPPRAWVILRTGWASRANDERAYMNVGADGKPHYPGWSKDSALFLTQQRDILGVGTEAVGTDAACGSADDPPFPNHSIMHGAGKFGLTQLANLDQLPATGAVLIVAPLKFEHGSGSPVRPIAIMPRR